MKKVILTAGICIASFLGMQAQQVANGAQQKGQAPSPVLKSVQVTRLMDNMTASCHLTADQVEKVKPIVSEFIDARNANMNKYGKDQAGFRAANQTSRAAMNTKLNAILNSDQQQQLVAMEQKASSAGQKTAQTK
jgi:hypothetical protein